MMGMQTSDPVTPAADLVEVARRFFPAADRCIPLGASTGFSGSHFARVELGDRAWCLRRWPRGFAVDRLRFIHRVLRRSRTRGFRGVPDLATVDGETILERGDALYDAQQWLPGEPLGGPPTWAGATPNVVFPLPPAQLAALAAALARFHTSTADVVAAPAPARPLLGELAGIAEALPARCATLTAAVEGAAVSPERAVAMRWLALLPRAVALAERVLRTDLASARAVAIVCHGDLWAQHVYVVGHRFSGFVDFERLACGSPASDLAQLILHFNGWRARLAVERAYGAWRPLGGGERALLPAAAARDLAAEALWSLESLYGADEPAAVVAHRHNLRALLPSLELLLAEMHREGQQARR